MILIEKVKKNRFFKNLKMSGMVSLGMLASVGHAFSQEKNITTEKNELMAPTPSWKFVEDSDSVLAENNSKIYPGLVENYMKDDEGGYRLYQYTDKDGNIVNTPDDLKKIIAQEKEELAKYSNPEEWAKKQFIYQKTLEFKVAELQKYIDKTESSIEELNYRIEHFTDTTTYSAQDRDLDKKNLDIYKKNLDYFKKHPEELAPEKSLEELTQDAKGFKDICERHIKNYQEELNSILQYIDQNK